jgi:hypothetical protein
VGVIDGSVKEKAFQITLEEEPEMTREDLEAIWPGILKQ